MIAKSLPPIDVLMTCMEYCPADGSLVWRARPRRHFKNAQAFGSWNTKYPGTRVGTVNSHGYLMVTFSGKRLLVHRICFALGNGRLPRSDKEIDHADGNPLNNQIGNLREATHNQNMWNYKRHTNRINDLPKGIYYFAQTNSYVARLAVNRRRVHVGYFPTIEEASVALNEVRNRLHGEFSKS